MKRNEIIFQINHPFFIFQKIWIKTRWIIHNHIWEKGNSSPPQIKSNNSHTHPPIPHIHSFVKHYLIILFKISTLIGWNKWFQLLTKTFQNFFFSARYHYSTTPIAISPWIIPILYHVYHLISNVILINNFII